MFAAGFIDAMRPTLIVPVVALILAFVTCMAVDASHRTEQPQREWRPERANRHEPAGVA